MKTEAMQQGRANKVLDKKFRYPEGIMTRKEHIELLYNKGYRAKIEQVRQYDKEEAQRQYLRSLWMRIPNGNECHPETKRHAQLKTELEKGIYRTDHIADHHTGSYVITKIEHDYLVNLQITKA